jgi:hypothetical protein
MTNIAIIAVVNITKTFLILLGYIKVYSLFQCGDFSFVVDGCSGPTAESPKGKIPHHFPIRYLRNFSEEIFLLWSMAVVDLLPNAKKERFRTISPIVI